MSEPKMISSCPDVSTLRALLDGTLPEQQQATTQAHVDQCPTCETALRQMTAGGESWIGMAEKLKGESSDDPKLAAAMERLKTDDGSASETGESVDPQRTIDFLQPSDDPKSLGRLGQHEVQEVVGWGGMGVVLKAYDPGLHRVVAVKVLASHLAHHAVARKRFIREAQAAAAVCHDNVVTIHAIDEAKFVVPPLGGQNGKENIPPEGGTTNALPKIVMQFVAGGSLQERIDQEAPLELKEILRIAMQTAAGLAAAHAQGVVHRDVKPANILLENGVQRVKLTDFGLARVMDDASLTLSDVIAGTPQYMAPEQAWGRDVDARADLFSLGAVMYAMCSGHSPFRARTTMAVLKRVCEDAPRPLRAINPEIPEWLVAIIEKLLAKNPDERFQTATEVSELLAKWLAHVQQPTVVPAPQFVVSPSGGINKSASALTVSEVLPPKGGTTNDGAAPTSQLSPKIVVVAMVIVGVLLGFLSISVIESNPRNMDSFLAFSVVQLLATFAMASAFRTAWNTSRWVTFIAVLFFLPFVASLFGWLVSNRDASGAMQLIGGLQALTALAYECVLLFVRPLFPSPLNTPKPERSTGRRRFITAVSIVLVALSGSILLFTMRSNQQSLLRAEAERNHYQQQYQTAQLRQLEAAHQRELRNRTEPLGTQPFPDPQLLSGGGSATVSMPGTFDPLGGGSPGMSMPPGQASDAAAVDSLKPLLGRWVVLTLQGEEPPMSVPTAGGMGMPAGMRSTSFPVVTPLRADQLRFLEFRDQQLFLNDSSRERLHIAIQKGHVFSLTTDGGDNVRNGIFTVEGDRLLICWSASNQPLPRGFQPSVGEQLVVCRREWSRPRERLEGNADTVVRFDKSSKLPKAEMPFSPREAVELQSAWAEKSGSPVEIKNSVGMTLRVIPPGTFGDPRTTSLLSESASGFGSSDGSLSGMFGGASGLPSSGERGQGVQGPILVGIHEVTVGQFRQFVEDSKYVTENERDEKNGSPKRPSWRSPEIDQDSDQHPVVNVTFDDALAFCHWLSLKEQKPYRLLTRREWEFCARAGSWLPVTLGPGKLSYRSQFFTTTAPVGSYSANSFGLHDFIGNVAEWAWQSEIPENDPRRKPQPDMGIMTSDPTVFCGGDFRQHIVRSQPGEWLHPAATKTPPMIGFRVACDLTDESLVSLHKGWPPQAMFVSQEIVRLRHLPVLSPSNDPAAKTDDAKAREVVRQIVWLEMLTQPGSMPYSVEWQDFEVQRRTVREGEITDETQLHQMLNSDVNWKTVPLDDALRLLDQIEFAPEVVPLEVTDPVLTMPIPKLVAGRWFPDQHRWTKSDLDGSFKIRESDAAMPEFQRPRLLRFIDFHVPNGEHYYRVRLKYRIPGITPERVHSTEWFADGESVSNDNDTLDQRKSSDSLPVIELKPPSPADPSQPADGQAPRRPRRR